MKRLNSIYDSEALQSLCRDPHSRRRFCNALFKKSLPPDSALLELPKTIRVTYTETIRFQWLELLERHDSKIDGATKLIFRCLEDGATIEAVILRITSGRTSLCISSQIGCAVGCAFCATGKSGFIRNLTAAEMLDQVLLAKRLLCEEGRILRNVVVMGTGEPLYNEKNLFQCLRTLRDTRFFNLSENHLMVSTVGITTAMLRFVKHFPGIQLALSLHSARQEIREKLIPIAKLHPLEKLKAVFSTLSHENFMIEYLILKGINDAPKDIETLINFLRGTNVHINLIQFNAYPGSTFQPITPEACKTFGDQLKQAGFNVTLRYSLGEDIAAACGQLTGNLNSGITDLCCRTIAYHLPKSVS